jgi:hypothetical protein
VYAWFFIAAISTLGLCDWMSAHASALPASLDTHALAHIPSVGEIVDGYRFLGGAPEVPQSWERVK